MLNTDTLNYLYTLRRRGIKVGLHRTKALLARCGNPHKKIPMIHIAGTNGKGSTAAMIASILQRTDRKVGLYTSPHLVTFNERIRVNGLPIADEQIIEFLNRYRREIDSLGSTFFETTTALTFTYFAQEEVDIAVVEVGLGGRLDSSNVAIPVVSVLTTIDFDHMEFLGYDLASITREKCGILRENTPVVVSPQKDEASNVIQESILNLSTTLYLASEVSPVNHINLTETGTQFSLEGHDLEIPLIGRHQVTNAQTAIVSCHLFDDTIDIKTIRNGLRNVRWPGRLQKMSENPLVYYDVAHNPNSLTAVLKTLQELFNDASIGAICALKKTKHVSAMGQLLGQYCRDVVTTVPDHGEFFSPESLAHELSDLKVNTIPVSSPIEALGYCFDRSFDCSLWLIFGTHHIAEAVFQKFHFPFDKDKI